HGDATSLDGNGPGAAHQLGLARRVAVEGHRGRLRTAGDRAVGPQARPFGWRIGTLFGPPRVEIFDTCAQRDRAARLPKKSQGSPYKRLRGTRGCVNWYNPKSDSRHDEEQSGHGYAAASQL